MQRVQRVDGRWRKKNIKFSPSKNMSTNRDNIFLLFICLEIHLFTD